MVHHLNVRDGGIGGTSLLPRTLHLSPQNGQKYDNVHCWFEHVYEKIEDRKYNHKPPGIDELELAYMRITFM